MLNNVKIEPPVPQVPKVEISLTLSPAEFATLFALVWQHVGGVNKIRSEISRGFEKVLEKLPASVRDEVEEVSSRYATSWNNSARSSKAAIIAKEVFGD